MSLLPAPAARNGASGLRASSPKRMFSMLEHQPLDEVAAVVGDTVLRGARRLAQQRDTVGRLAFRIGRDAHERLGVRGHRAIGIGSRRTFVGERAESGPIALLSTAGSRSPMATTAIRSGRYHVS